MKKFSTRFIYTALILILLPVTAFSSEMPRSSMLFYSIDDQLSASRANIQNINALYQNYDKTDTGPSAGGVLMLSHSILGYTTGLFMIGALITGVVSPKHATHTAFALGSAVASTGASITGLIGYREVLSFEDGLNQYNIHGTLGLVSTAGFITAFALGKAGVEHCAPGVVSGVAVTFSIATLWF